jgi:hypothetical protein
VSSLSYRIAIDVSLSKSRTARGVGHNGNYWPHAAYCVVPSSCHDLIHRRGTGKDQRVDGNRSRQAMLNVSLYTVIDRAITKTEGRSVQEYVICSMVFANIYVQDRGKWGMCM